MVFHWSLHDKSPEVSRTILSIWSDFNNTVVWMVSARPPISISLIFFTKAFKDLPSTLIIISITVTFIFDSFSVLCQGLSLSLFSFFFFCVFFFTLSSAGTAKPTDQLVLLFFFSVVSYHNVWSSGQD